MKTTSNVQYTKDKRCKCKNKYGRRCEAKAYIAGMCMNHFRKYIGNNGEKSKYKGLEVFEERKDGSIDNYVYYRRKKKHEKRI